MILKPKIEIYRFNLVHKEDSYKTFRDFATEELYQRAPSVDSQIMYKLFDYFLNQLKTTKAADSRSKKILKNITTSANRYIGHAPKLDVNNHIISGVITGGRFGRYGMMGDSSVRSEDANPFGTDKSILRYYYFLLYLPLDHNEGCFIIHSNSKEETITELFRAYICRLFKGENYSTPEMSRFCPSAIQDEFISDAQIKHISFKNTYVDDIFTVDGISTKEQKYQVKIEITPLKDPISFNLLPKIQDWLNGMNYSNKQSHKNLMDFREKKMVVNNNSMDTERTIELDNENLDVVPVVYLTNKIDIFNPDGTPDFTCLNQFCQDFFRKDVLPEIRPDLSL